VVFRLILASIVGMPIGVLLLQRVDNTIVLTVLGLIVSGYALYALLDLRMPPVAHPGWTFGVGFFSGLLSGAYNAGGPPVVMYAASRRWTPEEFKSNLHGFGLFTSFTVIALHMVEHHFTPLVLSQFLLVLPAVMIGLAMGLVAGRFINVVVFRRIILVLLLFTGLTLIF
jgi:uncharacterized membrane protein YfcA